VPSYLVAPNALFQVGLNNIRHLHRYLAETRILDAIANDPTVVKGAFLQTYGGNWSYRSNLDANHNGVDADLRHTTIQGGAHLAIREGTLNIGLAGSTGNLSFIPHNVNDAHKTKLEQWTISPHMFWQNPNGFYVDATLSRGEFKGHVSTTQHGQTARLKGTSQALSAGSGYPFSLGKIVLEPQLQATWQRLSFNKETNADRFPVHLGTLTQRTIRAGAEMTSGSSLLRIYARAHLSRALGDGQTVWIGRDFQIGRMGNALETSLGFDATLPSGPAVLTSFYADINYQKRLGNAGHQGWGANLGVKAKF